MISENKICLFVKQFKSLYNPVDTSSIKPPIPTVPVVQEVAAPESTPIPTTNAKADPINVTNSTLTLSTITQRNILDLHHNPTNLSPVPPFHTSDPYEHRTTFDSLGIHKIFSGFVGFTTNNTSPTPQMQTLSVQANHHLL